MKTRKTKGAQYQAPELSVLEIGMEGILCASEKLWYEKGGSGDFGYTVETDDTWA